MLALLICLTVLHYSSASSSSSLRAKIEQVTNDGLTKTNLLSDGISLYVSEVSGRDHVVMKVSGRNESRMAIIGAFPGGRAFDISHDHSRLLMSPAKGTVRSQELWEVPISSGSPRRIGNLVASDATWSSDGEKLALVKDSDLLMASRGGTSVTKLATLNGRPFGPRFSPDGKRIRFTVGDVERNTSTLWEIKADGSGLHELLPEGNRPAGACCGVWTADGGYYVF
ncbi:MAG: PD40 domain-containing protein, partial [Acidobacteriales bacterium]|nr:PD40 domain-containing protein [Terriglobales bacterium]